jgi:hypothetical protein
VKHHGRMVCNKYDRVAVGQHLPTEANALWARPHAVSIRLDAWVKAHLHGPEAMWWLKSLP